MTAEEFIRECTRKCSNELVAVEDKHGKTVISYHEWVTPDQALRAVEMARQESLDAMDMELVEPEGDFVGHIIDLDAGHIANVLQLCRGDRKEAARQLNIDVLTLDRWIEKYGLK